ncbi:MAG: PH domain-containing protein [Planctomycetes bacterium]|nr:PH domain-containing protein [Planctomycetota bacterium]
MATATAQPESAAQMAPVVVPARLIQEGEEIVLALKPSGLFILLISAPFTIAVIVLAVGAYLIDSIGLAQLPLQSLALVCLAAIALRLVVAFLQWVSRIYVLTNRRILRVRGVLNIDVFECALHRIQHTSLVLPLSERIFAIGTLVFATAGTALPEAAWVMIARPSEVHEIVVEYIRRAVPPPGQDV